MELNKRSSAFANSTTVTLPPLEMVLRRLLALTLLLLAPPSSQATSCHTLPHGRARVFCEWVWELQSAEGLDATTGSLARSVWREMEALLSTNQMNAIHNNIAGWNADLVQSLRPYARHLDDRPLRRHSAPLSSPKSFRDETRKFVAEWRALEEQLMKL